MRNLRRFFSRLCTWATRGRLDDRVDREIGHYVALQTDENILAGMPAAEARRQAIMKFGAVEAIKEDARAEGGLPFLDTLANDIRYALRMLRKSPGFAAVAILTIAMGIGATTAIFSVVDATLLHPLPYPHPEQLVRIQDDLQGVGARDVGMSQPEWQDLQRSGIFQFSSPAWYDDNNLTGGSQPARVSLLIVAPNYFSLLGVKAQLGRTFPSEDYSPSFTYEVVISDGLWKRLFAGDPNILGKGMRLDTDLYHIVGVMPPNFHDPGTALRERNIEVWAATSFFGPPMLDQPPRSGRNLPTAVARLAPGLTLDSAQQRVDALVASLRKQFPNDYPPQAGWAIRLVPLQRSVVGDVRRSLILLFGAVGIVLLIGCVNIANLLLARASARGREMAIRQALGAARPRLIRQLLTESLCLAIVGGGTGVLLLVCARKSLLRLVPDSLPRFAAISVSWELLFFALAASLLAGAVFGLAPAFHAGRVDIIHALKQESRGSRGSGEQSRTRRALVIVEFALSLVLMVAAGLLLRSFSELVNAPLGFSPQSILTVKTRLPYPNNTSLDVYGSVAQEATFLREVLSRCKALPGVEEVAMGGVSALPLAHDRNNQTPPVPFLIEGRGNLVNSTPLVDDSIVTPEYFHLMSMELMRGRLFDQFDGEKASPVMVINEAAARTFWPGKDPIGKRAKVSRNATAWSTIVGIVANARTESIVDANVPEVYISAYQKQEKHLAIFLKGNLDAAAIPGQVREQVQAVDPTIPVFAARAITDTVSAAFAERRLSLEMVALFALTALVLAALGIYGVISYIVGERGHEIGIRLALGAHRGQIVRMLLGQGLALAIVGAGIGLLGSVFVARLMAGLLYGVKPSDPLTFVGVALLLTAVALLACYLPARRAMNVDPMVALRHE